MRMQRSGMAAGALVVLGTALGDTLTAQDRSCRLPVRVLTPAGAPIADAAVNVGAITARTDSAGVATIVGLQQGDYVLRARRIGHVAGAVRAPARCDGAAGAPVELRLATLVQSLAPVVVRGDQPRRYTGPMAGFWERRDRGDGFFFTAVDIDRRNAQRMNDIIRTVPGWGRNQNQRNADALVRGTAVRMGAMTRDQANLSAATKCFPTVVVDGMAATLTELSLEGIDPRSLAGIEVYVDGSRTPSEFWGTAGQGRCGVVALWSRSMDAIRHTPLAQQNAMVDTVYEAHEVDVLARLDGELSRPPTYPTRLRSRKVAGSASVSFVVLPNGEPWMRDVRIVAASHKEFGEALAASIESLRFTPARLADRPVAQRATLTVQFGEQPAAPAPPASAP